MREKIMDSQEDEPRVPRSIETATEDRGKLREETLASSESTVKSTENEQDDEMTDDDAQTDLEDADLSDFMERSTCATPDRSERPNTRHSSRISAQAPFCLLF